MRQSELPQRRSFGERLSGRQNLPSLRRSGSYRRGLLQCRAVQPLLPRRPLRQGLSERRGVQRLQSKRTPKRLLSQPPMLCLFDQTQEWNTERHVIAVVPIITSTPSTTRTKSTYQLPLLWLGRIFMCSKGGKINDTIEIVKHPSSIKAPFFFSVPIAALSTAPSPKDIERHHRFEVGDEIREQTRHHHHAQSLQHAPPVRHHHLALSAVDPGLQRDQSGVDGDGVGEEAHQREADRGDHVEPGARWDVRQNQVLDAFCMLDRRNGETGGVGVEDDAADGEEDVDDAGDDERDDESVLEARRVLHAGLAVKEGEENLRGRRD